MIEQDEVDAVPQVDLGVAGRGARGADGAAADQYLLGQGATGLKRLDRELARGVIGTPKQSRAYRRKLLALLARYGYR